MNAHSAPALSRSIQEHHAGSLYRRASDGLWVAAVSLPDRSRRWAYATTKPAARARLAELLGAQATGLDPAPSLTVAAYLRRWLASVEPRVRHATFRSYEQTVSGPRAANGLGLSPALGHLRLTRLSVRDVETYLERLVAAGARGHTPARHRAVLSGALSDAMRWSLVGRNVAALARLPSTEPARIPHALSLEEARVLIDGTREDRLHALWVLALFTGLREAELLGLAWDDLDLAAGQVTVRSQLQRRDGGWVLTPPKTKAGSRRIALAPTVVDALREHQRRLTVERKPDWVYFGLVFVSADGRPLYAWRVLEALYAHEARLGLPRVTVHDLRHTAASLMLTAGLQLEDVKATLGHSSIRVTSDVYSHQQASQREQVGSAMQSALGAR